ncbi:MAG: anaerobic ribonucleoside-triphosphate reductase activating protein [Candidatus Pacearchaeota archaeon]
MKIKYIQKTTLVDYPGKIACTIFFFGCNFRCGFCYNPELVIEEKSPDLNEKEIFDFLEKRKGQLEGVCLTGGEPLLSLEENFLRKIKNLGYSIKIDTNGSFPEKLKNLIDKKLIDYISMDIKGRKEDYEKITNATADLEKVEESMKIISSFNEYEFRTTILEKFHDEKKVLEEVEWIYKVIGKKIKRFCLQGFKNEGKFIDEDFKNEKNTTEIYLNKIKDSLEKKKICEEILIRI